MLKKINETKTILWLTGLLFFIVNFVTLKDGHNWGDDFAQYIICAQNIAQNKPYTADVMINNPTIYPPGFPLILAPLIKIFGVNFKILKSLNIIFWFLASLLFFALARKKIPENIALILYVFFLFSSFFFTYKQNILSDIPFVFFMMLSLFIFSEYQEADKTNPKWQTVLWILFVSSLCFTMLVRSAGIVFFAATIFYFLCIERRYRKAAVIALSLTLLFAAQSLFMGANPGFLTVFTQYPLGTVLKAIHNNLAIVFTSTLFFFCPAYNIFSLIIYSSFLKLIEPLGLFFTLILALIFLYKTKKRSLSLWECFFFFYFALMILWSVFSHPPDAFVRFILPITGLFALLIVETTRRITQRWLSQRLPLHRLDTFILFFMFFLLFINTTNTISRFRFNDDALYRKPNQELFRWVKTNTEPQEYYMFWKPRALALMTGRLGAAHWIDARETWQDRIRDFGIHYLIMFKKNNRELIQELENQPLFFKLAWENGAYKIFRVLK